MLPGKALSSFPGQIRINMCVPPFHPKRLLFLEASPFLREHPHLWASQGFSPFGITILHHQPLFQSWSFYLMYNHIPNFYKSPLSFIFFFNYCTIAWLYSESFLSNRLSNHPISISP